MRKAIWIGAASLLVLGGLAGAGLAQEEGQRGFGFHKSHLTEDFYEVSVGVTAAGRPRTAERFSETRVHVVVPSHYGDLFQITQDGDAAVLWYRAADGSVRNTVLDAASSVPYEIEQNESSRVESKIR